MIDIKYFTNNQALESWTARETFADGEIAFIEDTKTYLMYSNGEWVPLPESTSESESNGISMNLYDLNKTIIAQLPIAGEDELLTAEKVINDYCNAQNSSYFMLLCRDISYYTVFTNDTSKEQLDFCSVGEAVISCAVDVGMIVSVSLTEDKNAIEIWVKNTDDMVYCMYLFNCAQMIVTYGG